MDAKRRQDIVLGLKSLPHKPGVNREDWETITDGALEVAWATVEVCRRINAPILFSSLIRPKVPASETDIHAEKRAFDLSIAGWSTDDIDEVLIEVNRACGPKYGAFRANNPDGVPRALIYEHRKGEGLESRDPKALPYVKENRADPHLHGQCRR